jgi:hypothetical protein
MMEIRRRIGILLSLCVVTPLGLWLWRYYDGPGTENAVKIAVGVFVVTYMLEVLQLWHAVFLEKIRSTLVGMAIIGTCFVWWQFPHYVLGSLIGLVWMRMLGGKNSV